MRGRLKSFFLRLTAPLRWLLRYELAVVSTSDSKDVHKALQRRALESTAEYVEAHLLGVDSVDSAFVLLDRAIRAADLGGKLVCEFGVASGATLNYIASRVPQTVYGFDSFEGLPERWREGFGRGHFARSARPLVSGNAVLIEGLFADSLPGFLREHPEGVGFLHIDCDLYSSTRTVLTHLAPRLRPGSVIVFDEYFNYPGWQAGEHKAFQEFIAETGMAYEYLGYNRLQSQVAVKLTAG